MENDNTLLNLLIEISNDIYLSIGAGYNEVVYHKAFEVALRTLGINYQSEVVTCILYKGHNVGFTRIDLLLHYNNKDFIIELKAVNNFNGDTANTQILSYLRQLSCNEGMIINFGQHSKNDKLNFRYFSKNDNEYDIYNYTDNRFVKQVNILHGVVRDTLNIS